MAELKEAWDPNQQFELLIDQVERAVDYADAGGNPYSTTTILNLTTTKCLKQAFTSLNAKNGTSSQRLRLSLIHI